MKKIKVQIPDVSYWRRMINCQDACPVHTDARGYVRAIANKNFELAYLIARGPNPLASICGRVCGAPCEKACRRGQIDEPISIRALKRFVCDQFGPEAKKVDGINFLDYLKKLAQKHGESPCLGKDELLPFLQSLTSGDIPKVKNKSVGIIGSGPAGLAAAHDLALFGFTVTLYEMESLLGGLLTAGIPDYRLPKAIVQSEIEVITSLGVKGVTNCFVGKDISFEDIRKQHDAVILAIGSKKSRKLVIPGGDANGVLGGLEFLRDIKLGRPPKIGQRIIVIGGGNVAYDIGRTVLRQMSIDAARVARRMETVKEVYLCSLESLEEMPADDSEIIEGDEEGVIRKNSMGPKEIIVDENNNVKGVKFKRVLRTYDAKMRFDPKFDENDVTEIACDNVLLAIGQSPDLSFIDAKKNDLELTQSGLIACDPITGTTTSPNIFVAGDLSHGPKLLIHAVASGKAVARTIYEKMTGNKITFQDVEIHFPLPLYKREPDYEKKSRINPKILPLEERLASHEKIVECGYTEEEAIYEASRCLDCGVNTIFNSDRCILCAGCVDVCPVKCLNITTSDKITCQSSGDQDISDQLEIFCHQDNSYIIKDETRCIRCGLCAERCPTGAITMERFSFKEKFQCRKD